MFPQLIEGDALTKLTELESESVDCCITSPPYWALRDYKVDGQLGLEPTIQEYISKLVEIFDQVKRVLRTTGSCWVVIGDTYAGSWGNYGTRIHKQRTQNHERFERRGATPSDFRPPMSNKIGIPEKSLCMIPERFSIAMIDHGWILRNKIIWYKPNCMPSSAKDRFTVDWEYVYFFVKSQKYFFETQYEPLEESTKERSKNNGYIISGNSQKKTNFGGGGHTTNPYSTRDYNMNPLGRIKRCVWKISTKPFSGAHFAVFPPDLVEPMIKAGCPEYICNKCHIPRKEEYEETRVNTRPGNTKYDFDGTHNAYERRFRPETIRVPKSGSDCGCNAGFHPGLVLDPFFGAGTVGLVAMQNARNFIGIELNPEYIKIAKSRLVPFIGQERLIPAV